MSSPSSSSSSSSPTTSTSNNCKQYSTDELNVGAAISVDRTENPEKKVCFICGSHTTQFINIYERRCGPNMIDVISQKFKMRPLNDDKFLCYSCNNWLINWYSMQKKKKKNDQNHDSSNEDAAQQTTTSSTMSAAIMANAYKQQTATKTSDDDTQYYDTNEMVIISDDDDEDNENIDVNNIVQTLRNRLKKYLYYPNRQKSNNQDEWLPMHPDATHIELNRTTNNDQNCKNCGKLFRRRLNRHKQRIFCRSCRFLMRRYGNSKAVSYKIHKNQLKSSEYQESVAHRMRLSFNEKHRSRVLTTNHHTNIFKKLQQLGTSIYYENEYHRGQEQHQRWQQQQQQQKQRRQKSYHLHRHMTSIPPHEIDMESQKNGTKTWKQHQNGSNEILMTFNTVVTEVFPIDELYSKYYGRSSNADQISNESEANNAPPNNFNIQEILRNVPKSLTITIAQ